MKENLEQIFTYNTLNASSQLHYFIKGYVEGKLNADSFALNVKDVADHLYSQYIKHKDKFE